MIVKPEQETVAPDPIDVEDRIRSALDVPTVPVATTVVPSVFSSAKYPAVPVATAVPDVIEFAVAVTVPADADELANAVAERVRVTSSVPLTAPFRAGCAPV